MTVDTKTNDDIFVPSLVTENRVLVRVSIAFWYGDICSLTIW